MLLMALGGGNFIGVVVGVSVGEDVIDAVGITDVANSPVGDVESAALASGVGDTGLGVGVCGGDRELAYSNTTEELRHLRSVRQFQS